MITNAFKGIGFTLPQKNRLKVAAEIGVICGNAWYEHEGNRAFLDSHFYPDEIECWSSRAKDTWRQAALGTWLDRKDDTAKKKPASLASKIILIGYQRVSTDDQHLHLQRDALVKVGVDPDRTYEDKLSGAKTNRPGLEHAIRAARKGDVGLSANGIDVVEKRLTHLPR